MYPSPLTWNSKSFYAMTSPIARAKNVIFLSQIRVETMTFRVSIGESIRRETTRRNRRLHVASWKTLAFKKWMRPLV